MDDEGNHVMKALKGTTGRGRPSEKICKEELRRSEEER